MAGHTNRRRTLSNLLIAVGAVVLLTVAGAFLWHQYRGWQLRARLQETPAPTALSTAATTARPTSVPALIPSPTAPPPTAVPPTRGESTTEPATPALAPAQDAPQPTPATPTLPPTQEAPQPAVTTPLPLTASAGPPVRLVIPDPALRIDVPVVEMGWEVVQTAAGPQTEWVIPDNEAGHHMDSAQLGEAGNLVISGHNNIHGRVFERISLAWPGQAEKVDAIAERTDILNGRAIYLYNAEGRRFDYQITDFLRLKDTGVSAAQRIENARFMRPTSDTRLTLVTCWPPWSNTHRLIVIAKPVGQP